MRDTILPSGSEVIDELLEGGIPYGATSGVFALPDTGKTWLTHQFAASNLKCSDKGSLIIETEAYKTHHYNRYSDIFYKRFNIKGKKIDYLHVRGLKELCALFGIEYEKDESNINKVKIHIREIPKKKRKAESTLMPNILKKYSFIAIDSFSKPFKGEISGGTTDFPARAQVSDRLFFQFDDLFSEYDIALFLTVHASKDPISPFSKPHQYGAETLLYNCKFLLGLYGPTKAVYEKWGQEGRRIELKRFPGIPPVVEPLRLKYNWGFE
jgi:archaellum biogenesis ATPase FlaH